MPSEAGSHQAGIERHISPVRGMLGSLDSEIHLKPCLKDIDIAFLPMNLPYTMTPEMVAQAAKTFSPKILYPYHFGSTNTSILVDLLKNEDIEVRIRRME